MRTSNLVPKFYLYVIAKIEKEYNKSLLQLINLGDLEVNKLLLLIRMGNSISPNKEKFMSEDEAAMKLQAYLDESEDNTLISAYIECLDIIDRDTGILKDSGTSANEIYESIKAKTKSTANLLQ